MPALKRYKTAYKGVYYVTVPAKSNRRPERSYYIRYYLNGKQIDEKAGRQFQDDMTPAKANLIRSKRIEKNQLSNTARKQSEKAEKQRLQNRWTIDRLYMEYKARNPNLKGLPQDECRYNKYLFPHFANKEPSDLDQFELDKLRINLLKIRKPQSVKHVLSQLRRIVNFGVNNGLCEGVKFKIKMPSIDNIKTEDLSPAQLKKLLQVLDQESNIQVANLMKLALYTGMRRGELFRLRWEDIDFNKGFMKIINPKGGKDQTIPLNDSARQVLQSHPHTEDSPFIFPGLDGQQRKEIIKQANRIKQKAGLPKDFRALHGLRHVYASLLASSGQVDMYTLQKLLTHKSPQMTQRYAHLRDESLRKASNLVGQIIQQALAETPEQNIANLDNGSK